MTGAVFATIGVFPFEALIDSCVFKVLLLLVNANAPLLACALVVCTPANVPLRTPLVTVTLFLTVPSAKPVNAAATFVEVAPEAPAVKVSPATVILSPAARLLKVTVLFEELKLVFEIF